VSGPDPAAVLTLVEREGKAAMAGADNRMFAGEFVAGGEDPEPLFEDPFYGVAAGNDPLFAAFKDAVGPFHWTPLEVFALAFPHIPCAADELSVLVYVLPQTARTRQDQRSCLETPSRRWYYVYLHGEALNRRIRARLADALIRSGIPAVAPVLRPDWGRRNSEERGVASNWSERHAAYAAGLGTFGLSDGLITAAGQAHRLGSVVCKAALPPTPRRAAHHHDGCLGYRPRSPCSGCIARCPAGAITRAGHDKRICAAYLDAMAGRGEDLYGLRVATCGLCQVGVPCENGLRGNRPQI
jgi:epoxyqueuosine reductase QueG